MPDIFDQIASPQGDIFDQISGGDIFDQIAPEESDKVAFEPGPEVFPGVEAGAETPTSAPVSTLGGRENELPGEPTVVVAGKSLMRGALALPKLVSEGGQIIRQALDMPESEFRKTIKQAENFWLPDTGGAKSKEYVSQAIESLSQMGTTAAVGGGAMLPLMAAESGAEKAAQSLDEGYSMPKSLAAGAAQAATEYLTEKIPVGILQKPGMAFINRLSQGLVSDIGGELVATATEMFAIDEKILGKKYTVDQYKQALLDTLIVSGMITGAASAGAQVIHGSPKPTKNQVDEAREAFKSALPENIPAAEKERLFTDFIQRHESGNITEGDIFDQVSPAEQGDVFDQISAPQTSKYQETVLGEQEKLLPDVFSRGVKTLQELASERSEIAQTPPDSHEHKARLASWTYEAATNMLAKTSPDRITDRRNRARQFFESKQAEGVIDENLFEKVKPSLDAANKEMPGLEISYDSTNRSKEGAFHDHMLTIRQGPLNGLTFHVPNENMTKEDIVREVNERLVKYSPDILRMMLTRKEVASKLEAMMSNAPAKELVAVKGGEDALTRRRNIQNETGLRSTGISNVRAATPEGGESISAAGDQRGIRRPTQGVDFSATPDIFDQVATDQKGAVMAPGENYVPIDQDRQLPGGEKGKVISRQEVIAPLLKALGQPVFEESIKRGKALGTYTRKLQQIKTKNRGDIEVVAHEVAHLIDDLVYNGFKQRGKKSLRPWNKNKTFIEELRSISYDKSKTHEGFAEFVRLWMTVPESLETAAPEFLKYWNAFVEGGMGGNTKIANALISTQKQSIKWFQQDMVQRIKSKSGTVPSLTDVITANWADHFRQAILDSFHGVVLQEQRITGSKMLQPNGISETMALSRAKYSIASGAIDFGPVVLKEDGSFEYSDKIDGLRKIIGEIPTESLDDWKAYAVARSAAELKAQGRENLITSKEIEAGLKLETPEFRKAFDGWLEFNNAILDFAQDMGLINAEQRKGWKRTQYIPFFRLAGNKTMTGKAGRPGEVSITRRLTGGTRNLNDILDNMVISTTKLITESIANQARRQVIDESLRAGGDAAKLIRKVPKGNKAVNINFDQVRDQILKYTENTEVAEAILDEVADAMGEEFAQFWMHGQSPFGENIVAIRRNGKMEYYQIADPLLYRAFAAMRKLQMPKGLQVIGDLLNAQRRGIQKTITLGLDFMAANPVRDALHAAVYSESGFIPVVDSIKGLNSRITEDKAYRDWMANGGGMASYYAEEGALQRKLELFAKKKKVDLGTVLDSPIKVLEFLESVGDGLEASTRLGEYKAAIANGSTPRHAAYLAREVSTDFARRGDSATFGFFLDAAMFLNPGIQSLDRAYRGFTKDQNRYKIMAMSAGVAAFSMALAALNYDNDDYMDMEDFAKDGYWHFYPTINGKKKHFTMPKIWEVGAIGSIAERSLISLFDKIKKEDPESGAALIKHISRIILEQFNLTPWPAFYKPIREVATNKSTFTGQKISPPQMERVEPWAQYDERTSELPKWIAKLTKDLPIDQQLSPMVIQHYIKSYLNFFGIMGLYLTDRVVFDKNVAPVSVNEIPIARRFVRDDSKTPKRQVREFYEFLDEASRMKNTINKQVKEFIEPAEKDFAKFPPNMADTVSELARQISDIRQQVAAARNDPDITPEELDKIEKSANSAINEITKSAVTDIKKAQQEYEEQK